MGVGQISSAISTLCSGVLIRTYSDWLTNLSWEIITYLLRGLGWWPGQITHVDKRFDREISQIWLFFCKMPAYIAPRLPCRAYSTNRRGLRKRRTSDFRSMKVFLSSTRLAPCAKSNKMMLSDLCKLLYSIGCWFCCESVSFHLLFSPCFGPSQAIRRGK